MIDAMHWLVKGAQPHDALFFHCKSRLFRAPLTLNTELIMKILDTVDRRPTLTGMRWMGMMMVRALHSERKEPLDLYLMRLK
jgi:hypothetical protein